MRALAVAASLVCWFVSAECWAGGSWSSAQPRKQSPCHTHDCALPGLAVVFGGLSGGYLGAWAYKGGELPIGVHVGGALVGSVSVVTGIAYATTSDPAPRFQAFGALACIGVGVPSLVLGLHGLITADSENDDVKPGPVPNWYGPSYVLDARGTMTPALAFGGAF
jgi:hypothetical protein